MGCEVDGLVRRLMASLRRQKFMFELRYLASRVQVAQTAGSLLLFEISSSCNGRKFQRDGTRTSSPSRVGVPESHSKRSHSALAPHKST